MSFKYENNLRKVKKMESYTANAIKTYGGSRTVAPLILILRIKPGLDGARIVEWRDVTCSANTSEQKRQSGYTTRRSSANGGPAALLG
jgi:hypothetical protein